MSVLSISFSFDYYPLFIIALIAWSIPLIMSILRFDRIPAVVAEIIAGYFIGRFLLMGSSEESIRILEFFALTGFIFLMFLSGLEIDIDQIVASFPRKKITMPGFLKNPFLVGLFIFSGTLLLSFIGSLLLSNVIEITNIWYFALIMITTSVGIILPILKNRGEITSRFGQMIIVAAAIADIFSIILFTITAVVFKDGFNINLLYIFLLVFLFVVSYFIGIKLSKFNIIKAITFQLSHAASQIQVRGAILLILVFIVLSQIIGQEVVLLGAFLCGLLLSLFLHKARSLLMIKLDGMGYGFFIPVFFIMVGVKFDSNALLDLDNTLFTFLGLLLITLFAVKIIPSLIWTRIFGFKMAMAGGFLIASRLSLIIAASTIGLNLGVISPGVNSSIVLMAVITCFVSPLIFEQLNPKAKFPAEKTIIIGGSSTAVLLARRLKMHNREVVIIEKNNDRWRDILSKGINSVEGDGKDVSVYEKVKLADNNYVVVLTSSDEENINICKTLRNDLNHERLITKANKAGIERVLKSMEVELFDATRVLATTIENLIVRPTTYHALVESFENYYVDEVKVTSSSVDGMQIRELPFHRDATLMLIKRGNDMYIPHGETYLKIGDIVNVFGTPSAMTAIRALLS